MPWWMDKTYSFVMFLDKNTALGVFNGQAVLSVAGDA